MAGVSDPQQLGGLELFRGLSTAELARVNDQLGHTKFPTGAMILTASQPGEIAYIVLDGTLAARDLGFRVRRSTLETLEHFLGRRFPLAA